MTVASTLNRKEFTGDAVTTSFGTSPITFFDSSDLDVYVVVTATGVATLLTENTHYTVSGGAGAVGTVNMAGGSTPYGAPAATETLVIVRTLDVVQGTDLVNNDASDAEVLEQTLDKGVMMIQQVDAKASRSFALADSDVSGASTKIPTPAASALIGWASDGLSLVNYELTDLTVSAVPTYALGIITAADEDGFFQTMIDGMTAESAPAINDTVAFSDVSLTPDDGRTATLQQIFNTFGGLTADSSPDHSVDTASVYDNSAGATKGVVLADILGGLNFSGRLTLTSGTPVTSADVTGATTVYFTPYKGNFIMLYNGTRWVPHTFSELSQATTDSTKSPAAVGANSNYDVFVWNDSGTLRATRGPAWSSDTARGTGAGTTELELVNGRYVNKVAITSGPAAQRGLYVGTIRSNASSQITDSKAFRHVWNNYNRVVRFMYVTEATASWAYSSTTLRQANGNTANQLDFVRGLDEEPVTARAVGNFSGSAADIGTAASGIGLDSTSARATGSSVGQARTSNANSSSAVSFYNGLPGLGRHFLAWLESAPASTTTWQGNNNTGIYGETPA